MLIDILSLAAFALQPQNWTHCHKDCMARENANFYYLALTESFPAPELEDPQTHVAE